MTPHRLQSSPLAALLQPIARLAEVPLWGYLGGAAVAAFQALVADAFSPLLLILIASHWLDYRLGCAVAVHVRHNFTEARSYTGRLSKMSGIALLLLIRIAEAWLSGYGFTETGGMVAAALGFGLLIQDVRSIERKRVELGAGPIPGLSAILATLDTLQQRVLTSLPPPPPPPGRGSER